MAKKIKFPLEMEQGVKVRSLDELKQNFSFSKIKIYLEDGRLVRWLRDRSLDEIADEVEQLKMEDQELPRRICEIFKVPFDEQKIEREKKLDTLKKYTTEKRFLDGADQIAFKQEELENLLEKGENIIYLCGERFHIPIDKTGVSYVGINSPVVIIESEKKIDWGETGISFENVVFDEKYQQVSGDALIQWSNYSDKSYLNGLLSVNEKKCAERMYNRIKGMIEIINFDTSDDICIEQFEELVKEVSVEIGGDYYSFTYGANCFELVFDKEKLNSYAKIIYESSSVKTVFSNMYPLHSWLIGHVGDDLKNTKVAIAAVKDFVKKCQNMGNDQGGCKFIFFCLMILMTDKTEAKEHLSLICDFASMLHITDDEMEEILYVVKKVYGQEKSEYNFKSEKILSIFGKSNGGKYKKYIGRRVLWKIK